MAATDGRGGAGVGGQSPATPTRSTGAATVDRRHWFGGLGVALAALGLGLAAGLPGLAAGLGAALAWFLLPAPYAFAAGQLLAVAALSADAPPLAVGLAEIGLFSVLAGPLTETDAPGGALAAFAVAVAVLSAVGWGVLRTGRPLWLAALTLAVVAATAAYGLHRYELVRLGLVTEEGAGDGSGDGSRDARDGPAEGVS